VTAALVVIVMVVAVVAAPGVTVAGEKLQLAKVGSPEQENCTGLLNPPGCGAMEMVTLAVWPAVMEAVDGAVIEKSWGTVISVGEDALADKMLVPAYAAE
jgi:hypothetical protein